MLALLRKEAREALVGLLLLCPLLSWMAIRTGTSIVVPGPPDHLMLVAIFAVAIGVCHGVGEFAIEERSTWRYLVHRSTGYRGAFLAKLTVDWMVLALLTGIPLCVHAAWVVWFTDDSEIALWSRYLEIVNAAAIAVGVHAIGVFASQLRRPTWLRFTIALAGSIAFLVASSFVTLAPHDSAVGPAARYLLWIGAISLPLYALSYRLFVAGTDDDRAFAGKLGIGVAICALALLAPSSAILIGAIERVPLRKIVDSQPEIWRGSTDGKLQLTQTFAVSSKTLDEAVRLNPGSARVFARTSQASKSTLEPLGSPWPAPTEPFEFGAVWDGLSGYSSGDDGISPTYNDVWLPNRGGKIVVVQHHRNSPMRRLLLLGKGSTNADFSSLAIQIQGQDTICVVDPRDRSLWSFAPNDADPNLESLSLPDNDRFVRLERNQFRYQLCEQVRPSPVWDARWVIVGEHANYLCTGSRFVVAKESERPLAAPEEPIEGEIRIEITRPDALEPTVVVRDAKTGATLFQHSYTNPLDVRTAAAYACSIVRPTIGSVASIFRGAPADYREVDAFFDPLLRNGRRVWLLALNVLLSAALAARAWRRGAVGDPRRVFETLAILLLGVPAAAVLALVEPRGRAARKVAVATAPREQLLISSG